MSNGSNAMLHAKVRDLSFFKRALDEHAIVSIADVNGNITYANDKFCFISGYSREELMGQNHRMLKSSEHPSKFYVDMWRTVATGRPWHGEIKNTRKNGEPYWVKATIFPFLDDAGKPFQYVSIRTDITTHKATEADLSAAKVIADKANNAKSAFLSSMSHELRTPMNAILGFAQMLEHNPNEPLSKNQKTYVEFILQAGEHLLELINQVLELSQVEAGKVSLNISPVSIREIIDHSLTLIKMRADREGITIADLTAEDDLPLLMTDRTRLIQVLLNLLSNAVKYNRKGGIVTLSCQNFSDQMLRINVSDTGYGIPLKQRDDLFKPFERLGREAGRIEGTGIGLAITRNLVELLGGCIGFESKEGKGSTFWIDIPKCEGQEVGSVYLETARHIDVATAFS